MRKKWDFSRFSLIKRLQNEISAMWLCVSAMITTNALSFEKDGIKWIFEVIFDEKQSYRDRAAKKA